MKDIARQIIESTLERLDKLEDFTIEHAPEICKELIAEREARINQDMFEAIAIGVPCLIVTAFLVYLLLFVKIDYDYRVTTQAISIVVLFFSFVGTLAAIGCFITAVGNSRVLKAAPKVFVLRELRNFLRS